ncbi:MAG: hypothetical protein WBL32_00775 [Acetivibrionales bacterium]
MGRCWELRFRGDLQWHAGVDPFTVETLTCGRTAGLSRSGLRARPADFGRDETAFDYDQGLNLLCGTSGAANSVACLEWVWWIMDQMHDYWPV